MQGQEREARTRSFWDSTPRRPHIEHWNQEREKIVASQKWVWGSRFSDANNTVLLSSGGNFTRAMGRTL